MKNSDRRFISIAPQNGLGNRVRALISFGVFAKFLNVPYYVYWNKTKGFDDTKLEDLVDINSLSSNLNVTIIHDQQWKHCRKYSWKLDKFFTGLYEHDITIASDSVDEEHIKRYDEYVKKLIEGNFRNASVKTSNNLIWVTSEDTMEKYFPNFWNEYNKCIQKIKLKKTLYESIKPTLNNIDNNTIGMHIRKGDAIDERNPNRVHYGNNTEYFIREVEKKIKQDGDCKIFLATDCRDTMNSMINKFGNKIITHKKNFVESPFNDFKSGQVDAMVEMYLLSKTSKIYGTAWSTFSEISAQMGNVEIEYFSANNF